MNATGKTTNNLINETSPYLLQHAGNPVDWYPWGKEAFDKAEKEYKPVFLSIGYSTCHWCHVMAHESFEDTKIADILNESFVSVKVDKEERPDIDSIYMNVCQAFTGSGGWPTSIFMTSKQIPFFAGTYFPKYSRYGMVGFADLLLNIKEQWNHNRAELIKYGDQIINALKKQPNIPNNELSEKTIIDAVNEFKHSFDEIYGGFGSAPKFPTPHNLLFLMNFYELTKDKKCLQMVEKTLIQMYKGGIFDHIGFGFSRYSTDRFWLAPHFEKMLYDNALLTIAYLRAYEITENELYKTIAIKTMEYVLRELTSDDGGFFCAQDADSDGVEGKYYVFEPNEIIKLLGNDDGEHFNKYFDITQKGNFEEKSIPNLIKTAEFDGNIDTLLPAVYEYRRNRTTLHKDDKILTSWNSLMIAAFANAYKILNDKKYLEAAERAIRFIDENLSDGDTLFVSFRDRKTSDNGFLDDYAFYIFALIQMYDATYDKKYLDRANILNKKVLSDFYDSEKGGFCLYSKSNEQLILKPKETYDGATPSGNSVMGYNLLKLARLTKNNKLEELAQKHFKFMSGYAIQYPAGHSFFMLSLLMHVYPSKEIVCILKDKKDIDKLKGKTSLNTNVIVLETETPEYPLKNNKTTFYICENNSCMPPVNEF